TTTDTRINSASTKLREKWCPPAYAHNTWLPPNITDTGTSHYGQDGSGTNVSKEVAGDDGVNGAFVGYSGTVSTETRKGDFDGLIGGEIVDAEKGTEVLYVEEFLDGIKGSGVG
ncbi:hypothetical protein H5410_009925, partial [Solanum commersonii]